MLIKNTANCDLIHFALIILSPNNPPPISSQDPFLYSVCRADVLPDLVRASF